MKAETYLVAMTTLIGILVLSIAFVQLIHAQEGQVTLNPIGDTYVSSGSQSSNYGGISYLHVSSYMLADISHHELVWLKFNLSQVPDGAVIDAAKLQVYALYLTESHTIYAHSSFNNSWDELTLSYLNMPSYNATSMDSEILSTAGQYYNWSVLDAVRNAADGVYSGSDVVTIMLIENPPHSSIFSVQFYSKENELGIPRLILHWSDVVPEFPSFLILSIFMMATLLIVMCCRRRRVNVPSYK